MTVRGIIRRNAVQDMALAGSLSREVAGKDAIERRVFDLFRAKLLVSAAAIRIGMVSAIARFPVNAAGPVKGGRPEPYGTEEEESLWLTKRL